MGVSHSLIKQPYSSMAYRILVVLFWTQYTVLNFVRAVIERLPYIGSLAEIFIPVCFIIAAMASLPWLLRRVRGVDVMFYVIIVLVVLFTMVFFPQNRVFLEEDWYRILISAALVYFIGVSFSVRTCSRDLFWWSLVGIVCVFLYRLYLINSGVALEKDDMDAAYKLLPSVMYLVYYASLKKQTVYWVIASVFAPVLLIFGTRGPLICVLVYFIVSIIFEIIRTRNIKKLLLITGGLLILLTVVINEQIFLGIVSMISDLFEKIGFSTRIFDFFLSGSVLESKGREYLIEKALEAIVANPIKGYGFMGDRYLFGFYVHNIWVEIWCHFGIILGTLLMLIMVFLPIAALVKTNKTREKLLILMLICLVFIKLSLSGSYVFEPSLYLMLGYSVAICRRREKRIVGHHCYRNSKEFYYEETHEDAYNSFEEPKENSSVSEEQ